MEPQPIDYRIPVREEDLRSDSELGRLARSTGAITWRPNDKDPDTPFAWNQKGLCLNNNYRPPNKQPANPPITDDDKKMAALKTYAKTLEEWVQIWLIKPEVWNPTGADGTFKFRNFRDVVDCTAFVVEDQDHIIATTAHSIFGNSITKVKEKILDQWLFVLGLTTDYVDVNPLNPAVIPPERIYEIDRALCGELYSPTGANDADELDWVLLKLKPNGHALPPPLRFHKGGLTLNGLAGDKRVVSVGHSWNQSMKFEDALNGPLDGSRQPIYRTKIHTNIAVPATEKAVLKHTFLHNLLIHQGHSGGPIMLQQDPDPAFKLIGIQGGTGGLDPKSPFGQKGLIWNKAESTITLIPPTKHDAPPTKFCTATRTESWEHLLRNDSLLKIYYKCRSDLESGELDLYLRVLSPDGNSVNTKLAKEQIQMMKGGPTEGQVSVVYSKLRIDGEVPPAYIIGATAVWIPKGGKATNLAGKRPLKDEDNRKVDPVSVPKESRFLEALGVEVCRNFGNDGPDDLADVARTTLFYRTFGVNAAGPSQRVQSEPEVVEIGFSYKLQKDMRTAMSVALSGTAS